MLICNFRNAVRMKPAPIHLMSCWNNQIKSFPGPVFSFVFSSPLSHGNESSKFLKGDRNEKDSDGHVHCFVHCHLRLTLVQI